MIKPKQRAFLRSLANRIPALFQVGKEGVTENFLKQIEGALETRELIKVHVLENAMSDPRDVCQEIVQAVGAEPVQVIGSKFVLYKESKENKKIVLPK